MELRVNTKKTTESMYKYNNTITKKQVISFNDELNNIKSNTTKRNNSSNNNNIINFPNLGVNRLTYSNTGKIENKLTDEQQILIEDKKIYESYDLKNQGIEFGSKEWKEWKETTGSSCIPRLSEPWQVRRAWRECDENASESERKVFLDLRKDMIGNREKQINLGDNRDCDSYLSIINKRKNAYSSLLKITNYKPFEKYIDSLNKIQEKIYKYL